MADPNIELLIQIAEALGDLRERLVFVGGCATALLITDPAAAPVRATEDVDTIVAIIWRVMILKTCFLLWTGDPRWSMNSSARRSSCGSTWPASSRACLQTRILSTLCRVW